MQTDKTEKKDRGAERRLAAECKTLVISSAHAMTGRAEKLSARIRDGGKDGRYDLLTTLDSRDLAISGPVLDQVVADAKLAIELHHGEQILVAVDHDPAPIVRMLKRRAEFRDGVEIQGINLAREAPRTGTSEGIDVIAVTCMDFRQHDEVFARNLAESLGARAQPAILAMAGGAKELVDDKPRGQMILHELKPYVRRRGYRQVLLTCHTDCGAFGGDAGPSFLDAQERPDPRKQRKVLEEFLRAATQSFQAAYPKLEVLTGIVRVDASTGKVAEILRV